MAAFRRAADVQAEGLEFDVHRTKDRQLVVIHDETVQRTTGASGKVRELTLDELRRLDAGSWFSDDFRGEKIPTLEKVLRLAADTGMKVNIELKNNKFRYPGMEQDVMERVDRFGLIGKAVLSSFNHYSLREVKERYPEVDTAILYMASLYEPWNYAKAVGVSSIHSYWPTMEKGMVEACRKEGLPVRAFTVNRVRVMRRMIEWGVDALISDQVERLQQELKG
ncbi:hypothetical protein CHM34_10210 [Paludifilum halophilum]|uniref:GP-PDE domain-containing protein n=2 Tax=Paludifilum halophilum TaxID=1642702 RepID=A0A235B6K2_9BACL|nr:hypothetical protein CHM34_10210 [Paludifilum halophilum]